MASILRQVHMTEQSGCGMLTLGTAVGEPLEDTSDCVMFCCFLSLMSTIIASGSYDAQSVYGRQRLES